MSAWVYLVACLAGGLGATLRWVIDTVIHARLQIRFPLGIFIVNVTGSFALGLATAALGSSEELLVIGTGLLGGYTTFSTVAVASATLADVGMRRTAAVNIIGTFVTCVLAALGGVALGQLMRA